MKDKKLYWSIRLWRLSKTGLEKQIDDLEDLQSQWYDQERELLLTRLYRQHYHKIWIPKEE